MSTTKLIKVLNTFIITATFLSISSFAEQNIKSPLNNVSVYKSDLPLLSIQNLSTDPTTIDIYGDVIQLKPMSGVNYQCNGYDSLELQFKHNIHDYFEVPCQSRIVIEPNFHNEFQERSE